MSVRIRLAERWLLPPLPRDVGSVHHDLSHLPNRPLTGKESVACRTWLLRAGRTAPGWLRAVPLPGLAWAGGRELYDRSLVVRRAHRLGCQGLRSCDRLPERPGRSASSHARSVARLTPYDERSTDSVEAVRHALEAGAVAGRG